MWFDKLSPEERLIAEQAVMNFRSLNDACDTAADGTVLAVAEQLAMKQGRELILKTLETSIAQQAKVKVGPVPTGRTFDGGTKRQGGRGWSDVGVKPRDVVRTFHLDSRVKVGPVPTGRLDCGCCSAGENRPYSPRPPVEDSGSTDFNCSDA